MQLYIHQNIAINYAMNGTTNFTHLGCSIIYQPRCNYCQIRWWMWKTLCNEFQCLMACHLQCNIGIIQPVNTCFHGSCKAAIKEETGFVNRKKRKKTIDLDRNNVKLKRIKYKLLHCSRIIDFSAGRPSHWLIKVKIMSMCDESKYDSDKVNIFN